MANLIDLVFLMLLALPLLWLTQRQFVGRINDVRPAALVANWLLPALYFLLMWGWQGASLGKLLCGIRIVDAGCGHKPSWGQVLLRWPASLLSALPLGLGLWWSALDAKGQAWHDRLSDTRVVRRRAREDGELGYVRSHWRGEQSLVQSFWVNNVLLPLPLALLAVGLVGWVSVKGQSLQISALAILLIWPFKLALDTWCSIGAWRAAGKYLDQGGSAVWALLTRLITGLSVIGVVATLIMGVLAELPEYIQMVRGIDPIGNASFKVAEDGRSMRLEGAIGMGDSDRFAAQLDKHPQVQRIELESPGGRVYEAERMVEKIRSRAGTHTWAMGDCQSACTLVFMAGAQRQVMPDARLGFHRASTGTYNAVAEEVANRELAQTYRELGLPEYFITKTVSTPSRSMWYPRRDELVAYALIPEPPKTLDVGLPARQEAALQGYQDALRAHLGWYEVEARFPGSLEQAAQRMHRARLAGVSADVVQSEGLRVLAQHMPRLILALPAEQRRQYLQQVKAQLRSAQSLDSGLCQALLGGSLLVRRQLPMELREQESRWLMQALHEPEPRRLSLQPTALELEAVRVSTGGQVAGLLAQFWSGAEGEAGPVRCEHVLHVLDRLPSVQASHRELVERVIFQRQG